MKKKNLKDMKENNRRLIVQALLDKVNMSRIELAQYTGLSPSTVTALVSGLLEDHILIETGLEIFTGGRRRKELSINADYGVITVVEVRRADARIQFFDMLLNKLGERLKALEYNTGDSLLLAINSSIFDFFHTQKLSQEHLAGIGLLFQEDMRERDFSVMFSTALTSVIITLKEAVISQFQVPVLEEYSMSYSVTEALAEIPESKTVENSVHICIAKSIMASVTIGGMPMLMKNGTSADLTAFMKQPWNFISKAENGEAEEDTTVSAGLTDKIASIIALLCAMFSIDVVFLSGGKAQSNLFISEVRNALCRIMSNPPPIRPVKLPYDEFADRLAAKLRKKVLLETTYLRW